MPTQATSADHHKTLPQPIGVTQVTANTIHLGDGAQRDSMSRGEVRSLKGFERRLDDKSQTMAKVSETTRSLKAHAGEQVQKATQLLEQALAVEGGDKLASALAKYRDIAKVQEMKADELHTRAVRGAEGCRVVLANVETRYGGIYKAVVDSPETTPAELDFYKD